MTRDGHGDWTSQELTARELDQACDRFEAVWQSSPAAPPCIEDFLPAAGHPTRRVYLSELLALDVHYRHLAGAPPTTDDYLERFPECADIIREACANTL